MVNGTSVRRSLGALFVLLVVAVVAGQAVGQPILLGYVETGSMEPALSPGDGFVAIPAPIGGSIQEGDVVVYEAEEMRGGGLTTHRVVGETDAGYVTRGDANPFTDQDNGEPPVEREQIVARALTVDGQVIAIPSFGTAVQGVRAIIATVQRALTSVPGISTTLGVQGFAYLLFTGSLLLYAVGEWRTTAVKHRERDVSRSTGTDRRAIAGAFAAVLVLGATAAMVVPAGTHEYGIVSAEYESERADVIPRGESTEATYTIDNGGIVPALVQLEPADQGVNVRPRGIHVEGGSTATATVTLHAPARTGYYEFSVVEYRYLALLPTPLIRGLYTVHPWIPIGVIAGFIGVTFYLFSLVLLESGRMRIRSRDRNLSMVTRVLRTIRSRD